MYDIVIVGAGIAGMTAAIYAKRSGLNVLVLESGVCGGQIVGALKVGNYPGLAEVSGADLTEKIYHQMNNLGVELRYEEVLGVAESDEYWTESDVENGGRKFWVVKTDEAEYLAKTVIIATGTEPRKLSTKQTEGAGERPISYCATCDGALYSGKKVVVVGSGNTAKHEIKYLEGIASKVYHIHHDEPIPQDAEAVFVAIGRVPATGAFDELVDLDDDGYVVASEDCKTSRPGVFVAGDCRTKGVRQLVTAAGDGAVAANSVLRYLK